MSSGVFKGAGLFRSWISNPPLVKFESIQLTCLCKERHSLINIQPIPLRVIFVFPANEIYLGSTVLRLKQVAEYVRMIPGCEISVQPIEKVNFESLTNAILVFTKVGLRHIRSDTFIVLRANGNVVILDELDGERSLSSQADYVLRPKLFEKNLSAFDIKKILPVSTLPDRRLRSRKNINKPNLSFSCVYVGSKSKYLFSQTKVRGPLQRKYISPYTWLGATPPVWSRNLNKYNFHLVASPFESYDEIPKTLTKFSTSLLLNALPIVGAWETHLDPYLAGDYPYKLLEGSTKSLLNQMLDFQRSFSYDVYDYLINDLKAKNQKLLCEVNFIMEWHLALSRIKHERFL